jgi:hypothetical protein
MIYLVGLLTAGLWTVVGSFVGQRYYRLLRDDEGMRPWPALIRAIGWGIVSPAWLVLLSAWGIVSLGFTKKK